MQTICGCAFALDAMYAALKAVPGVQAILSSRTPSAHKARAAYVIDLVHQCTAIPNGDMRTVRRGVRTVFKFRNWAVHPPSEFGRPISHPYLGIGVDSRFVAFGFDNAYNAMALTLEILLRTFENPRLNIPGVSAWAEAQLGILRDLLREEEITLGASGDPAA